MYLKCAGWLLFAALNIGMEFSHYKVKYWDGKAWHVDKTSNWAAQYIVGYILLVKLWRPWSRRELVVPNETDKV